FEPLLNTPSLRSAGVFPQVNLFDDGTNFVVRAEMPGVNKDSLDVTVKGDQLALSGERVVKVANASYHRREREGGKFSRTITLPEIIDGERIAATYKNGLLEVVLPRIPKAQPRKIQVN
ncbi:MAG: Hsp20/alpha crystallin family protein, partial [Myxococcaceae bacterium]